MQLVHTQEVRVENNFLVSGLFRKKKNFVAGRKEREKKRQTWKVPPPRFYFVIISATRKRMGGDTADKSKQKYFKRVELTRKQKQKIVKKRGASQTKCRII